MRRYLTREQFDGMQARLDSGRASLTVSRRVSRQFFTRVSNASIRATTGRSVLWQKCAIWAGLIASLALLVWCMAAVIYYFGWFAAVAVPIVGIFWTVIAGLTGDKGSCWYSNAGLVVGLGLALMMVPAYAIPLALFTLSLWIHRTTYWIAQIWLTALVTTSFGAYDMLVEHIDLEDTLLAEEQTGTANA